MKTLAIRNVSILAVPLGILLLNLSFNSIAYGQQEPLNTNTSQNSSNTSVCDSIPPARPTGGATVTRMQALRQCYKNISRGSIQSNTGKCNLPVAEPTGGATATRMRMLQECYKK